jgi:transmembrane sensor
MAEIFDIEKIDRYFKGEYSEKDASYVDDVLCDDSNECELKKLLSKQFDELAPEGEVDRSKLDHILYRIHYDINMKKQDHQFSLFDNYIKWTLRIASIMILPLAIFIGIHTYRESNLKKTTWVEIKAPAWTRVQFRLPDGTIGWLNSSSAIKYNGNFSADRQLTLTGEAFFDVYKDKKRPFIINTNEVTVKVLGTRFNIASYEDEKTVEVVLEEGKLIFGDKVLNKYYTMKPNDLVVYDKSLMTFSTEVVQPQKYCSWTEGKLVFRNDPLDVIARRLERWYNVEIEIDKTLSEDVRWRATFIDENLEEVLNFLKRSLPVNYRIEQSNLKPDDTYTKKKVIITPKTK